MLQIGVTLDQFSSVVPGGNSGIQFFQPTVGFRDFSLDKLLFLGEVPRETKKIRLGQNSPYLIQIELSQARLELLMLCLIFGTLIQHLLSLSQERAGKLQVSFQLILIQILRGEPVQLLDHNAFQLFHGNKCAGTGIF